MLNQVASGSNKVAMGQQSSANEMPVEWRFSFTYINRS